MGFLKEKLSASWGHVSQNRDFNCPRNTKMWMCTKTTSCFADLVFALQIKISYTMHARACSGSPAGQKPEAKHAAQQHRSLSNTNVVANLTVGNVGSVSVHLNNFFLYLHISGVQLDPITVSVGKREPNVLVQLSYIVTCLFCCSYLAARPAATSFWPRSWETI